MKIGAAVFAFVLTGCNSLPSAQGQDVSGASCTESCSTHFDLCPQIFANFPERGAVECPAERDRCLKACAVGKKPVRMPMLAPRSTPPAATPTLAKEAKLRELKHFYEEGLVSEDVYRARQAAILAEP